MTYIEHTPPTGAPFTPGWTDPTLTDSDIALHQYLTDCAAAPLLLLKEWAGDTCPWGTLQENRRLAAQIAAAHRRAIRRPEPLRQRRIAA